MSKQLLFFTCAVAWIVSDQLCECDKLQASDRPNIVVIVSDDMGFADVGIQGAAADVKTPHLDALARGGVRCTAGYVTAPQCSPSRAGILSGRYQQRFGVDNNNDMPLTTDAITIAERLRGAGYACGMVGKWHLEPNRNSIAWAKQQGLALGGRNSFTIPTGATRPYLPAAQGFDQFFNGPLQRYEANFDLQGHDLAAEGEAILDERFRIDIQADAAEAFISRNHQHPFFLYVGFFAPHVPLQSPQNYLDRFSDVPEVRRRYALAMIAAIDDGIGRIVASLRKFGVSENTLVVFLSDNGAPLHGKEDLPIDNVSGLWDGSINDPYLGEKGMLSEGGLRIPFIWSWTGHLPSGRIEDRPISSLDIAATAVAMAGLPHDDQLDGLNVLPYFTDKDKLFPERDLYWRFFTQSAVRSGKWKYIKVGKEAEYLFDLSGDDNERTNLVAVHPEITADLKKRLQVWAEALTPPGLPEAPIRKVEASWYQEYFQFKRSGSVESVE